MPYYSQLAPSRWDEGNCYISLRDFLPHSRFSTTLLLCLQSASSCLLEEDFCMCLLQIWKLTRESVRRRRAGWLHWAGSCWQLLQMTPGPTRAEDLRAQLPSWLQRAPPGKRCCNNSPNIVCLCKSYGNFEILSSAFGSFQSRAPSARIADSFAELVHQRASNPLVAWTPLNSEINSAACAATCWVRCEVSVPRDA